MTDINTYPAMNAQIVSLLRLVDDNPVCLYAAKRIEELEEEYKKVGKWVGDCCSECGVSKYNYISFDFEDGSGFVKPRGEWNFCPNCGKRMVRE